MDDMPGTGPRTVTCFAGLCDSAVPVQVGEKVIGFYDVGFQSLTHFNRVFRQVVGQSPSEYRESKSVRQMLN